MYVGIVALTILAMVYSSLVYTYGSMRDSRVIHGKLVKSLLSSTFRYVYYGMGQDMEADHRTRWLDVTPTSRVITRCTQDIQAGTLNREEYKVLVSLTFTLFHSGRPYTWRVLLPRCALTCFQIAILLTMHPSSSSVWNARRLPDCDHHIHTNVLTTSSRYRDARYRAGEHLHQGAVVNQARDVERQGTGAGRFQ